MIDRDFWRGRRVLLTGHTGFKGAWLAAWLGRLGAQVHGLALAPEGEASLFEQLLPIPGLVSHIGDIRDPAEVKAVVAAARPSVVLHLAAQALVRRSYRDPAGTVSTNVAGLVTLLEALRGSPGLKAILVATTDKVYRNAELGGAFAEDDPLGGHDPYSASKAAAEILTDSWAKSFFDAEGVAVATARAGNVIGGGDASEDRLIPDLWRAHLVGARPELRNPEAVRPWQWVGEPLAGYLAYAERLCAGAPGTPRALNFGPQGGETLTVGQTANLFLSALGAQGGWRQADGVHPHEAGFLALDAGLAQRRLGWRPRLSAAEGLQWTAEWYRAVAAGQDARALTLRQIERYEALNG